MKRPLQNWCRNLRAPILKQYIKRFVIALLLAECGYSPRAFIIATHGIVTRNRACIFLSLPIQARYLWSIIMSHTCQQMGLSISPIQEGIILPEWRRADARAYCCRPAGWISQPLGGNGSFPPAIRLFCLLFSWLFF